ncbi:MAG: DUF4190 domain-containing protein [Acidobacteria bacterium]|nr:MAG: DUF4190 domain-containing protein [Acidobacteriota bacterium]REK02141.1 MAG: DUF4190 domain-containing protein [Acidobacteriota bacterium]REK14057.1 MAG: DUF4190 domain-containing protein [Acidobacteriota bacterium]REK42052.1 MAG: DUF4190 domain-containing protein [Acidobacteriota bacterium]
MPPGFQAPETPPFDAPESPVEAERSAPPEPEPKPEKKPSPEPLPSDFADVKDSDIEPAVIEGSAPVPSFGQDLQSGDSEPPAAAEGESLNQTLAYISLGLGIVGLPCCGLIIPSIAAVITGFMARGNISKDPSQYGGGTFALIGIILGLIGAIGGIVLLIVQIFFGALGSIPNF